MNWIDFLSITFIPTTNVRLKNSHGKIYNTNTYTCTLPVKDALVDPFRTVTRRCSATVPGRKLRKGSLLEKRGRTAHTEGGEDAGERARHSRRSDAQEGERERPGGKWWFEIEERCESPHSVSRGVITLPPRSRRVFVPGTRNIIQCERIYGKSANHEAILGRWKQTRYRIDCPRIERELVRQFESWRGFLLLLSTELKINLVNKNWYLKERWIFLEKRILFYFIFLILIILF